MHLESNLPLPAYSLIQAEFDDRMVERLELAKLPRNWRRGSSPTVTQQIGDQWIEERRSLALDVPSAILPIETIYLINPEHPDFDKISIQKPEPFSFDDRLLA